MNRSGLPALTRVRIHPDMLRSRPGFGMLALVVLIGLVATILALSIPVVMRVDQVSRVTETARILEEIRLATFNASAAATYPVFKQRIGQTPGRLTQLLYPVTRNDAAFLNVCGGQYSTGEQTASRNWAPLLRIAFDASTGISTPMGRLIDQLTRVDTLGVIYARTEITTADLVDITMLDEFVDAGNGASAGRIRWNNISGSTARFRFYMTIDAQC